MDWPDYASSTFGMNDSIVGLRLRVMALIFLFFIHFLSFPILHVNIKIRVGFFSEIFKARMFKLGIHMDNELLYCGIENRTPCSYSSLYLSIFLSFTAKFVSQFSPELCRLILQIWYTYVEWVIVSWDWDSWSLLLFFYLYPFFLLSLYCMLTIKIVLEVSQEFLKLECWNLVYTWTMGCCVMGLRFELLALILPFICPFFCLLRLNLCHSFLRNCAG